MKRLRMAMIGAGTGRGQSWLSTVKKVADLYDLCALCEVNEERAKENAERWGIRPYTNFMTMLEAEKSEVVFCAIPPDGNHVITCLAAAYGAHIITEIPIAPTLSIANFMVETVKQHGVKLEIAENVYRWATEQLKKKMIESGLIGKIAHARLWYVSGAYHGFNAIRMLLGSEAKRVLGYAGKVSVPDDLASYYLGIVVPEQVWASAVMEFENGVVCLYEKPPQGHRGNLWEIEGSEGQLIGNELYIGRGSDRQRFSFQYEYVMVEGEQVLEHVRVDTDPPIIFENPFPGYKAVDNDEVARVQILTSFHQAVLEDVEPEYNPAIARRDLELWIAVRESALRGSVWLELPLTEETEFEKRMHEEFRNLYGHNPEEIAALATTAFPRGGVRWIVGGDL